MLLPATVGQAQNFCKSNDEDSRLIELENKDQLDFLSNNTDKMPMFFRSNFPERNNLGYTFLSGATFNSTIANGSGLWLWESGEREKVQNWVWEGHLPKKGSVKRRDLAFEYQHTSNGTSFFGFHILRSAKIVPLCQKK